MNGDRLFESLNLPAGSHVNQRVPKKLLLENGAPTAADKRLINDGIEELLWLAALKPSTIGVPEYRDDVREYLEIAVLRLTLRATAKVTRLVELIHRAVPYPLLLLMEHGEWHGLSAAHKRWSQGEAGKTVLEGDIVIAKWNAERDSERWPAFRDALAMGRQPRTTLYALYQGWIDTLLALQAARVTGAFVVAANAEHAALRHDALQECARLDAEIVRLRATAAKEKQMSRRVELNLELKRVEAAQAVARTNL
jgi:hypothetical protein